MVDDAVVVIENTHRIFANGKVNIFKAARMAAGEVFMPVLTGTIVTLTPFIPLLFWQFQGNYDEWTRRIIDQGFSEKVFLDFPCSEILLHRSQPMHRRE